MTSININCPINSTGYGITSTNIVKAIHKTGIDIGLFPIGANVEANSENDVNLIKSLMSRINNFDYDAPCLKIWHQHDLASKVGNGHYYTFPFFEVDKLTPREIHHLNYSDYIFVASEWAKQILVNNQIVKPIYVAPLGVDLEIFQLKNKIRFAKENYVFFHIGKWEHRKSQDFLIQAFNKAFNANDKVELWLLPHNPFLSENETNYWLNMVAQCPLKDKIKVYNRLPTQYHVAEFIDSCDCGVFLSRAEGWNNEIIESMALNKPIIATNYSAHTEYCNNKNSFLVNISETEPANDGKWFHGQGNWAKLDNNALEQSIEYMRNVYDNHTDTNPEGLITAKKYSWDRTAQIIHNTLIKNHSYANSKTKRR